MWIKTIALSAVLAVSVAQAEEKAGPLKASYKTDLLTDGVYVIHGPVSFPNEQNQGFMNNPSFIIGDDGVVVVDPGGSVQTGEMVLSHIEKTTDKPIVAVFNSHVHGDHWLGNQAIRDKYPDVPIYAHRQLATRVIAGAGAEWLEMALRVTGHATAGTKVVMADHLVNDGDVIKVAGLTFNMMNNGKAHTDTDIMVHVAEKDLVYLGDNCGNQRLLRLENGSFRGNIAALKSAIDTGAKYFVPGHGPSGGPEVASNYREYLNIVYNTVKQGYEDGLADFEIRPLVVEKITEWKNWDGFEVTFGNHLSTAYLEAEAADFE